MKISGVHWCSFPHPDCEYIAYRLWHIPIHRHTSPYIVINYMAFTIHYLQTWMCLQDFTAFLFFFHWKSREPKLRHWFSYQNAPVNGKPCSPTNCGCCLRVLQADRRGEDWWWKQRGYCGYTSYIPGWCFQKLVLLQSRNCYFRQLNIRDNIYIMQACMHAYMHTYIDT